MVAPPPCWLCDDEIQEIEPVLPIAFFWPPGSQAAKDGLPGNAPVHFACIIEAIRRPPRGADLRDVFAAMLERTMANAGHAPAKRSVRRR